MAGKELEIKIKWENGNHFTLECKVEGEGWFTVVMVEENSNIAEIWPHVETICRLFFLKQIEKIGTEMKS